MSPGELEQLVDALLEGVDLDSVRYNPDRYSDLSSEGYLLLVRWLAGERADRPALSSVRVVRERTPEEQEALDARLDAIDREDDGPLVLGGAFDGIELP